MVILLVYTLFGAVALVGAAQSRLIIRDQLRRQAAYSAEASVYGAIAQLEADLSWRPAGQAPGLGGAVVTSEVRAHGAFLRVVAEARVGDQVQRRSALLGADLGPLSQAALVLLAKETELVVSGSTQIVGPVWTDGGGVRFEPFEGVPFSGRVDGPVGRQPADVRLETAVSSYDRLLADLLPGSAERLSEGLPLRVNEGNLVLTGGDALLRRPVALVVRGQLVLRGPLHFAEGSTFAATDTLLIEGAIDGDDGLFISGAALVIGNGAMCSGQFVARESVSLKEGASPRYPSAAYTQADVAEGVWGGIDMKSGSAFDGSLLVSRAASRPPTQGATFKIERGARVRGAVMSDGPLDLRGRVDGTVATPAIVLERGFTTYHNWLVDAEIDLSRRPVSFVVPIAASGRSGSGGRLRIARWSLQRF